MKLVILYGLAVLLANFAIWFGIAYVTWHFVAKLW